MKVGTRVERNGIQMVVTRVLSREHVEVYWFEEYQLRQRVFSVATLRIIE